MGCVHSARTTTHNNSGGAAVSKANCSTEPSCQPAAKPIAAEVERNEDCRSPADSTGAVLAKQRSKSGLAASIEVSSSPSSEEQPASPLCAPLHCKAAAVKHIGYGPLKSENQDEFFVQTSNFAGGGFERRLFAIFDGHGEYGRVVAEMARDLLPLALAEQLAGLPKDASGQTRMSRKPVTEAISQAFCLTEQRIKEAGVDISNSGTTASVALLAGRQLWLATVGDSRALLCERLALEEPLLDEQGAVETPAGTTVWHALALSEDHRPKRASEAARLVEAGGRVQPKQLAGGRFVGEPRLWLPHLPLPGLMVSRSIGDELAATIGCTCEPEVAYRRLTPPRDAFLVIASDGVWDVLENQHVAEVVGAAGDAEAGCLRLLETALAAWEERVSADNISCVCVEFAVPPQDGAAPAAGAFEESSGRSSDDDGTSTLLPEAEVLAHSGDAPGVTTKLVKLRTPRTSAGAATPEGSAAKPPGLSERQASIPVVVNL